jgi:ABC-type glycerol-3-phosphate transport system substrate-binding protein
MTKMMKVFSLLMAVLMLATVALNSTTVQAAGYVKTMDLALPAKDGVAKDVDLKGVKVVWWHQHTGAREKVVQDLVKEFNDTVGKKFGFTVEAVSKGGYPEIFKLVSAGISTGELPEIVVAYGNQAAAYQDNKALVDLEAYVMDKTVGIGDDFKTDMYTSFFNSDIRTDRDNQRLGYSTYRSMEVLYYNVEALKELGFAGPPKTWDEFEKQVCAFKNDKKLGKDGYQIRTDASFLAAGAFAAGGDVFDTKKDMFTYDSDAAMVLPTKIADLLKKGCIIKTVDAAARSDQNSFIAGDSLFYTGSSSGIPFLADGIKKGTKKFTFDIAPIPGFSDKPIQNVYGASNSVIALKKSPAQITASWLFLRWFSETEPQAKWAKGTNYFPVRRSSADGLKDVFAAELSGKPFKSAFDLLGSTKEEPSVSVYESVRGEASKAFRNILDGASVKDELKKLNDLANKQLEEARAKEGKK